MTLNLRHLRLLLAIDETGSVTRAAERMHLSQPAVTQALARQEAAWGGPLFDRSRAGLSATERGRILCRRSGRAFALLDPPLARLSPRLTVTATLSQLTALVAVAEAQNYSVAARRLALAQPTVHRAVSQIEGEAGTRLFQRVASGVTPTRVCLGVVMAARLAFAEFDQAEAEIADLDGGHGGRIVIGALPLSRSAILPDVLVAFRRARPGQRISVIDGPYGELLLGLRRGEIDIMLGALRDPPPADDIRQEKLFDDRLAIVAGPGHPLAGRTGLTTPQLAAEDWVVPREGTPAHAAFRAHFGAAVPPERIVECGSIILMREILAGGRYLGCISAAQAAVEIRRGALVGLGDMPGGGRTIGITTRTDWLPTAAQSELLDLVRSRAEAFR